MDISARERLFISPAEAIALTGIGKNSMYELLNTGRLPARRLGKKFLISREVFLRWVNEPEEKKTS